VIEVEEAKAEVKRQAKAEVEARAEAEAAIAEAERQLAAERTATRRTSSRQRRKSSEVPAEPRGGKDRKEVSATGEPFPGRRATGRKRAKAFAGFERELAPLGPQTGFDAIVYKQEIR
jgi:hypothetical protein